MKRFAVILLILLTLSVLVSCGEQPTDTKSSDDFEFICLDTGKSDCMLLFLDGMTFMIDTADADDYDSTIRNQLLSVGVIDYLIITHYDEDHIGSAGKVIRNHEIKRIIAPSYDKSSSEYIDFSSAAIARGITIEKIADKLTITTEKGSEIVIYPPAKDYGDDNNNSLITAVYADGVSMLLMGDAEKARVTDFNVTTYEHFDIVKLPHHGDYFKSLKTFLANSEPSVCIATLENRIDADEDLEKTTKKYGAKLYYSCDGEVRITLKDGKIITEQ